MKKIVLTAILTILASNLTLIAGSPMLVKKVRVTNWSNDDARTGHKLPNGETREVVTYELVDGEAYSNSLNKTDIESNKVEEVEDKVQLSKEELKNIIAEAIAKSQQTQQIQPQPNIQKQENQERETQRLQAMQQAMQKQLEEQTRIKRNKEIKEYELKQIKIRIEGARKELDDFINNTIINRRSKVYRDEVERLGDKIKQANKEYSERSSKE